MKKGIVFLLMLIIAQCATAQYYISLVPSLTNSPGTLAEKSNLSFEVGKQWDCFSMGVDYGKTTLGKKIGKDTSNYFEVRPNLNIFQQGKFTNTVTIGIGFIVNAEENFVTEFTSGIEYAYTPLIHFNLYFGTYYYSGSYSASNTTFFGISIMKFFKPYHPKSLIGGTAATAEK
jgi:hypothetical protein